jgi:hypothetical protein
MLRFGDAEHPRLPGHSFQSGDPGNIIIGSASVRRIGLVLADDRPVALAGFHALFSRESNFRVLPHCRNGSEVVRTVIAHRPDVLLLSHEISPTGAEDVQLQTGSSQNLPEASRVGYKRRGSNDAGVALSRLPTREGPEPDAPLSPTRATVRAKIADGTLPTTMPVRMWAGKAQAPGRCVACEQSIEPGHVEYEPEFPDGKSLRFHYQCLEAWLSERSRAAQDGAA